MRKSMTLDALIQFVQSEMESNKRHTGDKGSMNRAKKNRWRTVKLFKGL